MTTNNRFTLDEVASDFELELPSYVEFTLPLSNVDYKGKTSIV